MERKMERGRERKVKGGGREREKEREGSGEGEERERKPIDFTLINFSLFSLTTYNTVLPIP